MVVELEAHDVGTSPCVDAQPTPFELESRVRPAAGDELPLIELQHALLDGDRRAARRRRGQPVAVRPVLSRVVLALIIRADRQAQTIDSAKIEVSTNRPPGERSTDVDDGEGERIE